MHGRTSVISIHHLSSHLSAGIAGSIAAEAFHSACKVVLVATRPGTNPVAGFPPCATAATAAASKAEAPRAGHINVQISAPAHGAVLLEPAALEAAGAAGEVVGAALAVPVSGPHIGARAESEGRGAAAPAEAAIVGAVAAARPLLAAPLARVPPAEVEVLA